MKKYLNEIFTKVERLKRSMQDNAITIEQNMDSIRLLRDMNQKYQEEINELYRIEGILRPHLKEDDSDDQPRRRCC